MRIFFLICSLFLAIGSFGQDLGTAHRGTLKYRYYKLTFKEAHRLYKEHTRLHIDSFMHDLVLEVPNDSFGKILPEDPGHYLLAWGVGNNVYYKSYSKPFLRVGTRGVLGEGQMHLYDFDGNPIIDAEVKLKAKKGWDQIEFDEGCGCYAFPKQMSNTMLSIKHGEQFDFYQVSNQGLVKPSIDRSNPYAGQRIFPGYMVFNKPKYRHFDTVKMKAFIVTNEGRPLRRPLKLYVYNQYKWQWLKTVKPTTPGAYVADFVVSDSLRLDQNYSLKLAYGNEQIKTGSFRVEDYELKKARYSSRMLKYDFNKGDKVEVVADALDANGMPMLDTRVKVHVKMLRADVLYPVKHKTNDTLINNLFSYNKMIDPTGTSIIEIPARRLLPVKGYYQVTVEYLGAEGEYKTFTHNFWYDAKPDYYRSAQLQNKLLAEYYEDGKRKEKELARLMYYHHGKVLMEKDVYFPIEEVIHPAATHYTISHNDSLVVNTSVRDISSSYVSLTGKRSHDSVEVALQNPWGLDVYCRVYRDKNIVHKHFGAEMSYKAKDVTMWPYYVLYGYQWAGVEHFFEVPLVVKEKELNVEVDVPKAIYPGASANVSVHVTDYKKRPRKKVNLTAYSVNMEFLDIPIPQLPYFGRRFPKMSQFSNFYVQQVQFNGSRQLNYEYVRHLNIVDTNYYLQARYPKEKTRTYVTNNDYQMPEFVPLVVYNGVEALVASIWIDDRLLYSSINSDGRKFAFRYPEGTYDIKIRTYQHTVVLKDVTLKNYTRTYLSLDPEHNGNKKTYILQNQGPLLDEKHVADINAQTFFMDAKTYAVDSVWIENNGHRWLIRAGGSTLYPKTHWYDEIQKTLMTITGLKEGKTVLRINRDTFYFNFDPSQYYTINYGVLSNYPLPRYPLNREVLAANAPRFSFDQCIVSKPLYFRSDIRKYNKRKQTQQQKRYEGLKWYETMRNYRYHKNRSDRYCRIKLFNPYQKKVKYLWMVNEEQPVFSYAGAGASGNTEYPLKRGKYTLIAIDYKGKAYLEKGIDLNKGDYLLQNYVPKSFKPIEQSEIEPYRDIIHRISRPTISKASLFPMYLNSEWTFKEDTTEFGSILGVLKNTSNADVAGVTVMLEENGVLQDAVVSNAWGEFIFRNVQEGNYMLKLSRTGYRYTTVHGLPVKRRKTSYAEIIMQTSSEYVATYTEPVQPATRYIKTTTTNNLSNGTSKIYVRVHDIESGEELPFAKVLIKGTNIGAVSNVDGVAILSNVPEGRHQINISYLGYQSLALNIDVQNQTNYEIEAPLKGSGVALNEVVVVSEKNDYMEERVFSAPTNDILRLPARGVSGVVALEGVTSMSGAAPVIRGNRSDQVVTYIDGVPVRGSAAVAADAVGQALADEKSRLLGILQPNRIKDNLDLLEGQALPNRLRTNFKDYGYWVPNLVTDREGMAYFKVTFPDNITQWQSIVPAMDYHRNTGLATTTTKAFLPYTAQIGMPRFLVRGDSVALSGKVFKYVDEQLSFNVNFSVDSVNIYSSTTTMDVKDRVSLYEQGFVADTKEDSVDLSFVISNDEGFKEGERKPLNIFDDFIEKKEVKSVFVQGDTSFTVSAQQDEIIGVVVFNDEKQFVLDQISRLKHYNYGCVEQTASKLFALLAEKRLCNVIGKNFKDDRFIKRMIARLSKFQKPNGSWGWWQNDSYDGWITIYATRVLTEAQSQGFQSHAQTKAMKYLRRNFMKFPTNNYLESRILMQEFGWEAEEERFAKLRYAELNPHEKLLYLRSRQLAGAKSDIAFKVMELVHKNRCGDLYWGNSSSYFYYDKSMSTLLALRVLAHDGSKPRIVKTVERSVFAKACNYGHYNTLQRAMLIGYIMENLSTELSETASAGFAINGKKVIEIPKRYEQRGGEFSVGYQGVLQAMVFVFRSYEVREATGDSAQFRVKTQLIQKGKEVGSLSLGADAQINVTVYNRLSVKHSMIEIPIPAGCSYGTKEFPRFEHEVHREYRRNKVVIYCTALPAGVHRFSVSLEPRFAGKYTLLPTMVEQMYFPDQSGNNAVQTVVIK